jgi:hypothetical protein
VAAPRDPRDPTRRIPPARPVAHERQVVHPATEGALLAELLDRLSSLRAGLAVVAVLATAALGVAVWTLLAGDRDDARQGASPVRVERLEDRLDDLESDVEDAASQSGAAEIRQTQRALEDRLRALEEASGDSAAMRDAVEEVAQSVEILQDSVDELEARLDVLEQPE